MDAKLPQVALAELLAERIAALDTAKLPAAVRTKCDELLIDVIGLCVTARNEDYVKSALDGCDDDGPCTTVGHKRTLSTASAAFVNGTAAHGEDYDDTFEGGPVHAGAVIVPAVLAACERHNPDGPSALTGIAIGVEVLCRLSLVAPTRTPPKAGFHPTAIFGAMGAAAGVAATHLKPRATVDALGIAGSMASGIIEYLAEGAWTKRMHPGWAAQAGLRAALLGRAGFSGPRTGVQKACMDCFMASPTPRLGDYRGALTGDFGKRWVTETLAFKPYACGTMAHPYIDCARRLAVQLKTQNLNEHDIVEGWFAKSARAPCTAQWEPLANRTERAAEWLTPTNSSRPIVSPRASCAASVRISDFSDAAVKVPAVLTLAAKCATRSTRTILTPKFHRPHPCDNARRQHYRRTSAAYARRRA